MSPDRSQLKSLMDLRRKAFAAFNRWEAEHPSTPRSTDQVFASLGAIYDLIPPESRKREEDPQRMGIQAMHRALRHLKRRDL